MQAAKIFGTHPATKSLRRKLTRNEAPPIRNKVAGRQPGYTHRQAKRAAQAAPRRPQGESLAEGGAGEARKDRPIRRGAAGAES